MEPSGEVVHGSGLGSRTCWAPIVELLGCCGPTVVSNVALTKVPNNESHDESHDESYSESIGSRSI